MPKKIVEREKNKGYYRLLHWPIWIWVFFILPGHLTHELFIYGFNRQHGLWLALVVAVTGWRAWVGRLPGCEFRPYVTHFGVHQPNLWYRVVCYTAAWIDLLVPFTMNAIGLVVASLRGEWIIDRLYSALYYPVTLAILLATLFDFTPRARRSTRHEGAERAWFYVAIWTVAPTQTLAWAAWRLGGRLGMEGVELAQFRLAMFAVSAAVLVFLGVRGALPRSSRYHAEEKDSRVAAE